MQLNILNTITVDSYNNNKRDLRYCKFYAYNDMFGLSLSALTNIRGFVRFGNAHGTLKKSTIILHNKITKKETEPRGICITLV